MSNRRWDLSVSHKDKSGKWRSSRVGVMFEGDKGQFNIKIDPGVSISTPEGVNLTAWPPKERDGGNGGRRGNDDQGGGGQYGGDDHDQIPF